VAALAAASAYEAAAVSADDARSGKGAADRSRIKNAAPALRKGSSAAF
jgi:hypothetical protein